MGRPADGRNVIAIDIDTKNGGTLEALTQNRCWPTATASAITPSGGTHFLLRLAGNQRVRTRIGLIKGVDLIGEQGLIVVEPSAVDDKEYVWVSHPAQGIAPAPAWLLNDLRRGDWSARPARRKVDGRGRPKTRPRGHRPHDGQAEAIGNPSGRLKPTSPVCCQRHLPDSRSLDPAPATIN